MSKKEKTNEYPGFYSDLGELHDLYQGRKLTISCGGDWTTRTFRSKIRQAIVRYQGEEGKVVRAGG
jgi:hypothetical protein